MNPEHQSQCTGVSNLNGLTLLTSDCICAYCSSMYGGPEGSTHCNFTKLKKKKNNRMFLGNIKWTRRHQCVCVYKT